MVEAALLPRIPQVRRMPLGMPVMPQPPRRPDAVTAPVPAPVETVAVDTVADYKAVTPVYSGVCRIIQWTQTENRNGQTTTVNLGLADCDPDTRHPFRDMHWSPKPGHGARFRLVISLADDSGAPLEGREAAFLGEATLAFYGWTCAWETFVKLNLDVGDGNRASHPLRGIDLETPVSVVFWNLGDDERPVPPKPVQKARKPQVPFSRRTATQQATAMCASKAFCSWAVATAAELLGGGFAALPVPIGNPMVDAVEIVRHFCGVASRRDLSAPGPEGEAARLRWDDMLSRFHADMQPPPYPG